MALAVASGGALEEARLIERFVVDMRTELDAVVTDGAAQQIEEIAVVGLIQVCLRAAKHLARHHVAADDLEEARDVFVASQILGSDPVRLEDLPGVLAR